MLKEIIRSLGLVLLGVMIVLGIGQVFAANTVPSTNQVGRYQLFQGYYKSLSNRGAEEEKDVFLLDTATGRVTRRVVIVTEKGMSESWEPTDQVVATPR